MANQSSAVQGKSARDHAFAVITELVDAGAILSPHTSAPGLAPGFVYELTPGGNRARCRTIIAEAKNNPAIWREMVADIARRARGEAA